MASIELEQYRNKTKGSLGLHPLKLMLYISFASIFMFFAVTTSALLVKKGDTINWVQFRLPSIFFVSTLIAVACSVLMHFSLKLYKSGKFELFRKVLLASVFTGLLFLVFQLLGFKALTEIGMPLAGNASGSFIWFIAIVHGLHVLGGMVFSLITYVKAYRNRMDPIYELRDIINPKRVLSLELLSTYWHFIDLLWVYLYLFFYFNYQ
jgi:cytochrome c oxidase subunit III